MTDWREIAESETLAAADPPWSKHEEEAHQDATYDAVQAFWSSPAGIEEQRRQWRRSNGRPS
jgi:hypothetical protein